MPDNMKYEDGLKQRILTKFQEQAVESRRALAELIAGEEEKFQYFLDGYVSVGILAITLGREGLEWPDVGQPGRRMTQEEERIFATQFRTFMRQLKVAVSAGVVIVRDAPTMQPVAVSRLSRWISLDETQISLDEMADMPLYVAFDELRQWLAQIGLPIPEMLSERATRLHALGRQALPSGLLNALRSGDHHETGAPAPRGDMRANTKRGAGSRAQRVGWREAIVANWPGIVREYGDDADARAVIAYLKAHDTTGYIVAHPGEDELKWRTQQGSYKTLLLKTVRNALSGLRKLGLLKA